MTRRWGAALILVLVTILWMTAETRVDYARAVVLAGLLLLVLILGPAPQPPPASCPRCGGSAPRLRIPLFAQASLGLLVWGGLVVLLGTGLAAAFAFDLADEWLIAIVALAFAAYAGARGLLSMRLSAADKQLVYRCQSCHFRFERKPVG